MSEPQPDPLSMLDELEKVREALSGIVAAFVADGFTDEQARDLTVAIWVQAARSSP